MAYSYTDYPGTGALTDFAAPPYLSRTHIYVTINSVPAPTFEWVGGATIRLPSAPSTDQVVRVGRRTSQGAPLVTFVNGAGLPEADLNTAALQAFYMSQEALDAATDALSAAAGQLAPDGSDDEPGYAFLNAPSTGIRRNSTGGVSVVTNGTEVARCHPNGDVSLGRDGPTEAFRVMDRRGNGETVRRLEAFGEIDGRAPYLKAAHYNDPDATVDLRLVTSGAGRLRLPSPVTAYGAQRIAQATHVIPIKDDAGVEYWVPVVTSAADPGTPDLGALAALTGATADDPGTGGTAPAPLAGDQNKVLHGDAAWRVPTVAPMVGSTAIANGTSGAAPQPNAGTERQFLRGDGVWAYPERVFIGPWITDVATNTSYSQTHSLGNHPDFYAVELECLEADLGISPGVRTTFTTTTTITPGGSVRGVRILANGATVFFRIPLGGLTMENGSGSDGLLTLSRWRFRTTAVKFTRP